MSQVLRLYLAHRLTEKKSISDPEKLNNVIRTANIDLNPHQVDAAVFAFKSPLSRGAILADEVGLGKTIEAGLIINELWVEGRQHILILVPASLCRSTGEVSKPPTRASGRVHQEDSG